MSLDVVWWKEISILGSGLGAAFEFTGLVVVAFAAKFSFVGSELAAGLGEGFVEGEGKVFLAGDSGDVLTWYVEVNVGVEGRFGVGSLLVT